MGFDLGPSDVLFNNTNSRELVGKTAPILAASNWTFSNHMTRLRVLSGFSNRFVAHQLHFLWMVGYFKEKCTQHINQASVSSGTLANSVPFIIPPFDEQAEIATALDQRMEMLESVSKSLELAIAKLDHLKKMVFRKAAEGGLVPTEHRAADADGRSYQHAAALLREILSDSREQMEIDLDTEREKAIPGGQELPQGWVWARVDQVGDVVLGRQRAPRYQKGKFMRPYLRVANVFEDRIDATDVLRMNFTPQEFEKYRLEYGDILLNEGQSLAWVGRAAMFRNEVRETCLQNTLLRFRSRPGVSAGFALLVFRHYLHSGQFQQIARWSTNIAHLGRERFASMRFPLPPLAEQERIVIEAQRILSVGESQEEVLRDLASRLFVVRRKMLEEAFQGKVAPLQISEPANVVRNDGGQDQPNRNDKKVELVGDDMTTDDAGKSDKRSLYEILKYRKSGMSPDRLFEESGIEIDRVDDYYEELKREVLAGRIEEHREGGSISLVAI